ncbi:MAG TPA: hypothetical protein VK667_06165 [Ktedonobacteraceae bacterium]|nr:hypothetical protein [Ktedonobacteraceae bacterium]
MSGSMVHSTTKRLNTTLLTWSFWSLVILCAVTALVLRVQNSFLLSKTGEGAQYLQAVLYQAVLTPLISPAYATVGAIVAARRPNNSVGWLCLAVGLLVGLQDATWQYTIRAHEIAPGSLPAATAIALLSSLLLILQSPLPSILILLVFPDGKFLSRRWWWLACFAVLCTLFALLATLRYPTIPAGLHTQLPNPLGLQGSEPFLAATLTIVYLLTNFILLLAAASILVRWQRATGEQRQQLKWLVYVGSLIILCGIIGFVCSYLPISAYIGVLVGAVGFTGTSIGIPLAIGFAMLRYHLYDIDVLINRTLVYGTLTGILAIIYLGGVFGLQLFLRNMTGQASQPDLAIVGSTLAIAALFQPLRNRIQDTIDRRFYRRRYDAAHTLEAFSAKLREEVDLTQISEQLVAVVEETMQPQHVSLWLRQSAQSKEDSSNMHHPRL